MSKYLHKQVENLEIRFDRLKDFANEMFATVKLNFENGYLVPVGDNAQMNLEKILERWQRKIDELCSRYLLVCDACDGDGSLAQQKAKEAMLACGGQARPFYDGRPGVYYVDEKGQEMGMKTIGGYCSVCRGSGTRIPKSLPERTPGNFTFGGSDVTGFINLPKDNEAKEL